MFQPLNLTQSNPKLFKAFLPRVLLKLVCSDYFVASLRHHTCCYAEPQSILYSIKWVIRRLKSNICLGLASLQHVFDSLTDNGKGVLKLIIKEQINQIAKQKEGPTFKGEFYSISTSHIGINHNDSRELIIRFYYLILRRNQFLWRFSGKGV